MRATCSMRGIFRAGERSRSEAKALTNSMPAAAMSIILTATGARGRRSTSQRKIPATWMLLRPDSCSGGRCCIPPVVLNYRPNNVAPVIDEVVVQPGMRFASQPKPVANVVPGSDNNNGPRFDTPPAPIKDSGSVGVRWSAHDDNEDDLVYTLFYRGDNESAW